MVTRRQFLQVAGAAAASTPFAALRRALADGLAPGLSDPLFQPKFLYEVPNALNPAFMYRPDRQGRFKVRVADAIHETGLIDLSNGRRLKTKVWGYGDDDFVSWPGKTFEVRSSAAGGPAEIDVRWSNELFGRKHLLPVDTNLHWCYSLHGASSSNGVDYSRFTIAKDGVPIITHLHGGNSDFQFDGNPEFFYSPDGRIKGPQWDGVPGGFTSDFRYNNAVPAGSLWYHDHALGITRLNVYAGLAGFYFVRDPFDTGLADNPLGLPAYPHEMALAIQDRMFTTRGALFYPAFPGDPSYDDFITEEGAFLPPELFSRGGPTALAEFFGDHMLVNGVIWPKADVEPRNYRLRLLNGTDSRFLVIQLVTVAAGVTDPAAGTPIPFYVIGSDQGLGTPAQTETLVMEPGGRYDVIVDFSQVPFGSRIIMKNLGGDAPFGGAFGDDLDPEEDLFPNRQTDRVMAFDVVRALDLSRPDGFNAAHLPRYGGVGPEDTTRRVALFEGVDEFGRLQPLLGTVKAGDLNTTNVAAARTWFQPPTETPAYGSTEVWEIYNFTEDAHPIHLHLVNFEILDRRRFSYQVTGTRDTSQHNGTTGRVPEISYIQDLGPVNVGPEYFEAAPKDMVTALPGRPEPPEGHDVGQVVRIRATFNKPGRYVWHCHILSHEDHEMMRVLQVG